MKMAVEDKEKNNDNIIEDFDEEDTNGTVSSDYKAFQVRLP